jgi:hypothetical protein
MAPAGERLASQEQVGHTVADIDMIIALDRAGPRRQRFARLPDQLFDRLVQADYRPLRVVGPMINRQHVLHVIDKLG